MTREQKRALANFVVGQVAKSVEFFDDTIRSAPEDEEEALRELPMGEVVEQVARWLAKLPATTWPVSWPDPGR